jgi:hypothetical protein
MKGPAIKHCFQRSVVDGGRELHGGRVRRTGYLVGISTMLPAARAPAAVAPGDREVFPWTPVILALHASMQGQDAHWLTIAVLTGSAILMFLTKRGTALLATCRAIPAETLVRNALKSMEQVGIRATKRKFRLKAVWRLAIALAFLMGWSHSIAFAQPAPASEQDAAESLGESEYDPTATLTQIQIKDIYTPAEYGTNAQPNTLQIRSIFAFSPSALIPFEQLIRPTIKIVTEPVSKGASTNTGYDDMQLLDLLIVPWPNSRETDFRWGIGPYFVFPTASIDQAGQGAWQIGPATGFAYRGIPGLNLSGLLQQATSFAYTSSHSSPVTSITFQPIITYQLGHDWYVKSSDATWTFNLRHKTSTTIPLSAGAGKVWELADGYSLDTSLSGEWMAYRQFSNQTEQFSLNFQVSLLLPKVEF